MKRRRKSVGITTMKPKKPSKSEYIINQKNLVRTMESMYTAWYLQGDQLTPVSSKIPLF